MVSSPPAWIISENYAGLMAQGVGLAEAAGLAPMPRPLTPGWPWRHLSPRMWPSPLSVAGAAIAAPAPALAITCGGAGAAVGAALRRSPRFALPVVQVQHPRRDPAGFDLVVVNCHDGLSGPNVIVTRTALHRATPARLAEAAEIWRPRFAHLPRPLVAVLVGGANGRFRLGAAEGTALAQSLAGMMAADKVGLMLTPSRRTDPAVTHILAETLTPRGGYVWDGSWENPYFGMLALADAIIVTMDSVSMLSEAVATHAPVLLARLPGRSRRIGQFVDDMIAEKRVRDFAGRLDLWPVAPLDDTQVAGEALRQRLGV